jgi:hypothetical protein
VLGNDAFKLCRVIRPPQPAVASREDQHFAAGLHRRSALFVYAIRPLVKSPDQTYDFLYGCSRDGGNVDWQAVMSAVGFMEHVKQLMLAKEKQ